MNRIVILDTETSGMTVKRGGRVIEIGALLLESGIVVDEFDTLIDTEASIQYGAYRVHGISEEMLHGKPLPEEVWRSFREFVGDADLVAHNAPFDSTFIRNECCLIGMDLLNRWHCTVRLARQKLPLLHNHKLDTVYRYLFGPIPMSMQRHRALDDARLVARIWMALKENY